MTEPILKEQGEFYIVAHEPGAEHPALPTWANDFSNPARLTQNRTDTIQPIKVDEVPGAFQLFNVFSEDECQRLIELTESLGYLPDAAVSLPRSIRHNHNVTWVADTSTTEIIWQRCAQSVNAMIGATCDRPAIGLNQRFRFYRYEIGDFFDRHTDGAWPGSAVEDHILLSDAFNDRWSLFSFIAFLSEGYEGGHTQFYVRDAITDEERIENIRTPLGAVLCFPHGHHPLHCVHSSEPIRRGTKYIFRSDILVPI